MSKKHALRATGEVAEVLLDVVQAALERERSCDEETQALTLARAERDALLSREAMRHASVFELDAQLALLRASPDLPGVKAAIRALHDERRRRLRSR